MKKSNKKRAISSWYLQGICNKLCLVEKVFCAGHIKIDWKNAALSNLTRSSLLTYYNYSTWLNNSYCKGMIHYLHNQECELLLIRNTFKISEFTRFSCETSIILFTLYHANDLIMWGVRNNCLAIYFKNKIVLLDSCSICCSPWLNSLNEHWLISR